MKAVRISPVNGKGADYVLTHNGSQYVLSRNGQTGRYNGIGMTHADVIAVCNELIDAIEADQ